MHSAISLFGRCRTVATGHTATNNGIRSLCRVDYLYIALIPLSDARVRTCHGHGISMRFVLESPSHGR